jgi:hypothetical protein
MNFSFARGLRMATAVFTVAWSIPHLLGVVVSRPGYEALSEALSFGGPSSFLLASLYLWRMEAFIETPRALHYHRWFAWYPVAFGPHIAWLSKIERRWHSIDQCWYFRRIPRAK